jgi:hypothetical protein
VGLAVTPRSRRPRLRSLARPGRRRRSRASRNHMSIVNQGRAGTLRLSGGRFPKPGMHAGLRRSSR